MSAGGAIRRDCFMGSLSKKLHIMNPVDASSVTLEPAEGFFLSL